VNEKFKGLWIARELLEDPNLSKIEMMVMAVALSYKAGKKKCFASNGYFSKLLNVSKQRSSQIINELEKKGYLKTAMKKENGIVISRIIDPIKYILPYQEYLIGVSNKFDGGYQIFEGGVSNKCEGYNNIYNILDTRDSSTSNAISKNGVLFPDLPKIDKKKSAKEPTPKQKIMAYFKDSYKTIVGEEYYQHAPQKDNACLKRWYDQHKEKAPEDIVKKATLLIDKAFAMFQNGVWPFKDSPPVISSFFQHIDKIQGYKKNRNQRPLPDGDFGATFIGGEDNDKSIDPES